MIVKSSECIRCDIFVGKSKDEELVNLLHKKFICEKI
jgi:hypothetical protein